jgi:hypothetical protein
MNEPLSHSEVIAALEDYWAVDGFFFNCRAGSFDPNEGARLLEFLNGLASQRHPAFDVDGSVPFRLVTLTWFIPTFLEWQRERVGERGGDLSAYDSFRLEIVEALSGLLGYP